MIFWSCFRGVWTAKIELSPRRELNFHFFTKFDFSLILGSILESFWGPSSQLYSFLEAQRVSKKVFERSMKKRCEKKAAGDTSDAGIWGGVPYFAECRPQTSKPRSRTPATGRPKLRLATTPQRALRHGGGFKWGWCQVFHC